MAARKEAAQPAQPEIAPQDIVFEDGKAIMSRHVHIEMPVSTMRLYSSGGRKARYPIEP